MAPDSGPSDEAARYLREHHAPAAELALWTRDAVVRADPDLRERVYPGWQGVGFRHPEAGYVCAIFPRDRAVELLFEHGAAMVDPEGVLEGAGSQTRVIRVEAPSDATAELIFRYVQQAIAERLLR
jgi:hypothetical protein